jgi:poly(3-hydroxybutyrate) depolymerase
MDFLAFTFSALLLTSSSLASVPSQGCGLAIPGGLTPGGPSQLEYIPSQEHNRSYLVHLPSNYNINKPAPLILGYHGNGKDAAHQEEISGMSETEYDRGYVVVYPNGVDVSILSP